MAGMQPAATLENDPAPGPRARGVALYLCVWVFAAAFFASQTWLGAQYAGRGLPFTRALGYAGTDVGLWAVLALPVIVLARRFPIGRGTLGRALLVHVPCAFFLAVLQSALAWLIFSAAGAYVTATMPVRQAFGRIELAMLHPNLLYYATIVGVVHLRAYHARWRDRELRASRLEARLASAELEVLKMQLHPHFLFNTLHAISALMHRDVEAADRMLVRLGDLLRIAMEDVGAQEVTLRHEMEFLERYLEIQQIRFGDRLRMRIDVPVDTLDARVPALVLQPLVENAIRHAIAPRSGGGTLEIVAARDGDRLRLEVRDDGPGLPAGGPPRTGVGLANTRARLDQLHGAAHTFAMENRGGGGLTVTLSVPFVRESAEAAR